MIDYTRAAIESRIRIDRNELSGSICAVKGGYAYALPAGTLIYYSEPYISGRFL